MRRPRSGIGAELVPLVLILACLAGSLAMIVSAHRRAASRRPSKPAVAVALPPTPAPPAPAPVAPAPEVEEPEPPPPPAPEDPTPQALAKLVSAEAEQLLEASKADRKAAALEEARKSALAESERWRRRESLVRLQLDSLDSKVRRMEAEADAMALERDALEKELDARKAMAAQARSRPGQAILPHRGANGTWRRPIVVECRNGMAILQPQGIAFGLFELASGFGPASNPFVATVAREAIRIQGNASPDGQAVIPYIFFLVRPDGIRPYYEARGRLEPLGITFGYELADQDWQVDFPDLDDVKTWDGSAPALPSGVNPLAQTPPRARGASPAEDDEFPSWGAARRGQSLSGPADGPGGEFVWPPRTPALDNRGGGVNLGNLGGSGSGAGLAQGGGGPRSSSGRTDGPDPLGGGPSGRPDGLGSLPGDAGPLAGGLAGSRGTGPGSGRGTGAGTAPTDPPPSGIPGELALGGGPIAPLPPGNGPASGSPGGPSAVVPPRAPAGGRSGGQGSGALGQGGLPPVAAGPSAGPGGVGNQDPAGGSGKDDPANTFVWPAKPRAGSRGSQGGLPAQSSGDGSDPADPAGADQLPPVRHVGPFSRPLAMGLDTMTSPNGSPSSTDADPTQPDGSGASGSTSPAGKPASGGSQSASRVIGRSGTSIGQPSSSSPGSASVGLSMPNPGGAPPGGMPSDGTPPSGSPPSSSSNRSPSLPEVASPSIVDRRFEVVIVCGPRGVVVQPGGYRVTSDALDDRDGLLKKQMVALVKARRTADPKTIIEPRVRFLVQPGGDKTYWTARSQFLLSGLDWPMSLQVAEPDHLGILPSESW